MRRNEYSQLRTAIRKGGEKEEILERCKPLVSEGLLCILHEELYLYGVAEALRWVKNWEMRGLPLKREEK